MAQNQAYLFLVFTLTGIIIGILFDFFRILRKSFKTCDLLTYIEDVAFWVLTGIIVLYNIWYFNDGEIRLFMLLGISMGAIIYALTLSNFVVTISTIVIKKIKFIVNKIFNIILIPLKPIIKIFRKIIALLNEKMNIFVKKRVFFQKIQNKRGNLKNNGE